MQYRCTFLLFFRMFKLYQKIHKFSSTLSYFTTRRWIYENDNIKSLWNGMSSRDKQLFNFNICSIDWDSYFKDYIKGVRVYYLKDDMVTLPQAIKKWNR